MAWKNIERPGYFGKKRDDMYEAYNCEFGRNWRIIWKFNSHELGFPEACNLYEDAYYHDSFKRENIWKSLLETAADVYDIEEKDRESGFDYELQTGPATHLQDIAIRRVVLRRAWKFQGNNLIQIRSHSEPWGKLLSPGKVDFHLKDYIIQPQLAGWWDKDSVEDFYQSNKFIQARKTERSDMPSLIAELEKTEKTFSSREEKYEFSATAIKNLLQKETQSAFSEVMKSINEKLNGKAPKIESFDASGNFVSLRLKCYLEDLDEREGDIINQTVEQELKTAGLGWIKAGFSPYYYGK